MDKPGSKEYRGRLRRHDREPKTTEQGLIKRSLKHEQAEEGMRWGPMPPARADSRTSRVRENKREPRGGGGG